MEIKKNLSLILGISIPLIMVLIIIISIYIPPFFAHPKYNFLYMTSARVYENAKIYTVINGKLEKRELVKDDAIPIDGKAATFVNADIIDTPHFFIYDIIKNESTEITFEQARVLILEPNVLSPDGFKVVQSEGNYNFFIFSSRNYDYYAKYIKGHGVSQKINSRFDYDNNFSFLGWIIK